MSELLLLVGLVVIVNSLPTPLFGDEVGPPPPPPCGLPPFMDKLPTDAQIKLQHIWRSYKEGADCSNQHHETRQILDSLPTEVRSEIFEHGPHPPPPFGDDPPPPPPCGLPPFIDKLPADAQTKLRNIWQNYKEGADCSNEHDQTRQILDSLPAEVRSAIFRDGPSGRVHSLPQEVRGAISRPPPEMRAANTLIDQFTAIMDDESISWFERQKKMLALARKVLKGDELKRFNESIRTMKFTFNRE
ncbi:hypothetical protein ANCCAN_06817 [Ancylostoma caninum]|uniref:SXP/RAL-2 family protein Ani s 5-like cation-binding domain-containing protein n=1 Tax=Ancylostoma caninum TaxID=29170 RepID=A0A368GU25_ANCCA|nr:hypothetical protein ANCCAN_06817 [Ancylostoma caninum]